MSYAQKNTTMMFGRFRPNHPPRMTEFPVGKKHEVKQEFVSEFHYDIILEEPSEHNELIVPYIDLVCCARNRYIEVHFPDVTTPASMARLNYYAMAGEYTRLGLWAMNMIARYGSLAMENKLMLKDQKDGDIFHIQTPTPSRTPHITSAAPFRPLLPVVSFRVMELFRGGRQCASKGNMVWGDWEVRMETPEDDKILTQIMEAKEWKESIPGNCPSFAFSRLGFDGRFR